MHVEQMVSGHYAHGELLTTIENSIARMGKTTDSVTIDDLAAVDEFHIGGRLATEGLLAQLNFSATDKLLDVGCGLGGAARYVANKYRNHVTGIDLTHEYIDTGNVLSAWLKLDSLVELHQGSALAMPFEAASFDGGFMLHVGMNIADKEKLFSEIYRVLRPGTLFGVYDVMRIEEGELAYPVPWAADAGSSALATPDQYKTALMATGFAIKSETNRREFALQFFEKLREKMAGAGGPPPLGLHILMKESTPLKIKNMVDNVGANYVAPVEIIVQKP